MGVSQQFSLHHQERDNAEPDAFKAEFDDHREYKRYGQNHHGNGVEKTGQEKIDQNDDRQNHVAGDLEGDHPGGRADQQLEGTLWYPQHVRICKDAGAPPYQNDCIVMRNLANIGRSIK